MDACDRTTRRRRRGSLRRAGYFDAGLAPGLRASGCGLRKVGLAGATFLSAFGFFASRLPCCLSPLPMIVHPCWHVVGRHLRRSRDAAVHSLMSAQHVDPARRPHASAKYQRSRSTGVGPGAGIQASEVRSLAADFSGWETNNTVFESQLERLVRALRADEGGRETPPIKRTR
jgi:hypothetical protein